MSRNRPDTTFLAAVAKSLDVCHNMVSFTCTAHVVLPSTIHRLVVNKPKLTDLKLEAILTRGEMVEVLKLNHLKSLALDYPTRIVLDQLPHLLITNMGHLRSLSITNSIDLAPDYFTNMLGIIPQLRVLRVQDCLGITHRDVLRAVGKHCKSLESLAVTIYTSSVNRDLLWPSFLTLRHMNIHIRQCPKDQLGSTVSLLLDCAAQAALESITVHHTDKHDIPDAILTEIVKHQSSSLKRLNIINFRVAPEQVDKICSGLHQMQQFAFYMPSNVASRPNVLAL
ncbi:hypothetical protein FRB99_008305 [Tulasnella sp. 403]|nr:hypothetical protein FRB99_008305 [Tulasnella sp. 403]